MPTPKPFDSTTLCPKCLSDQVASLYRPALRSWEQGEYRGEHIERRCERCHYTWAELCLDGDRHAEG